MEKHNKVVPFCRVLRHGRSKANDAGIIVSKVVSFIIFELFFNVHRDPIKGCIKRNSGTADQDGLHQ